MKQSLIDRIQSKRKQLGTDTQPLALDKCAVQIDISTASLRSVIKYGEAAAGAMIKPKIEAWLQK